MYILYLGSHWKMDHNSQRLALSTALLSTVDAADPGSPDSMIGVGKRVRHIID